MHSLIQAPARALPDSATPDTKLSRRALLGRGAAVAAGALVAVPAVADAATAFADDRELMALFNQWRQAERASVEATQRYNAADEASLAAMPERPAELCRQGRLRDGSLGQLPLDACDIDQAHNILLHYVTTSPAYEALRRRLLKRVARYEKACARIRAAHDLAALSKAEWAASGHSLALAARIIETPARSALGVAIKLALGSQWGELADYLRGDLTLEISTDSGSDSQSSAGTSSAAVLAALRDAEHVAGLAPGWRAV
jgi:hypothetical protein